MPNELWTLSRSEFVEESKCIPSSIDLARATIGKEIESLVAAQARIGPEFDEAVGTLAKMPGKIIITGLGKSGLVARKIAAAFCGTGTPALFVHPVDALHGDLGVVQEGDVAILLSKSGETAEVLAFCDLLKSAGCPTIATVGRQGSSLVRRSDISLDGSVESEACPLDLAPTSSVLVAIALGDALAVSLVDLRGFTAESFSRLHPSGSLGKRLLLRVEQVMHTGDEIPVVSPGTSLREALITLTAKAMGAVLIVEPSMKLRGVFTDGDLRRSLERYDDLVRLPIEDVMTRDPIVVYKDDMAVRALEIMENRPSQIAVLPVLDADKQVVGILRLHDLIRAGL